MAITFNHNDQVYVNDGKLGIGTDSPAQKLHIKSTTSGPTGIIIENTNNAQSLDLDFWSNAGSVQGRIRYNEGAGSFDISTNAGAGPAMTMLYNGNVGIGTTSPGRKLTVQGADDGTMQLRLMGTASQTSYWDIGREAASTGQFRFIASRTGTVITPMVIDDQTGNVGIGTISPGANLDVQSVTGTLRLGNNIGSVVTGAVVGKIEFSNVDTSIGAGVQAYIQSRAIDNGATYAMDFFTGTKDNPTQTNLSLYNGNVGIGTSSPNNILHLYTNYAGSSNSGSAITIVSDGSGGDIGWIGVNKGTGNGLTFGIENRDIIFQTDNTTAFNGTERMRITSAGNVGIGITTPSELLHLLGADATVQIQGSGTSSNAGVDFFPRDGSNVAHLQSIKGVGSSLTFLTGGNSGNSYVPTERMRINAAGNVGIGTTGPTANLHIREVTSNSYASLRLQGSNRGGIIEMYNGASLPVSSIQTDQSGNTYISTSGAFGSATLSPKISIATAGNVGIGTTNPTRRLHVRSTDEATGIFLERTSNYGFVQYNQQVGSVETYHLGYVNNNTLSSDILVANELGNVGIGTTNPLSPLHQVGGGTAYTGEARFGGSSTAFGIELKYNQADATSGSIYVSPTYSSADVLFKLGAGLGNTNQLVLQGNGNVGIGTTAPDRRLYVVSSDDTRGIMVEQTLASSYAEVHFKANREYRIGTGGSTSAAEAANNWYVYDATAAAQRFVITSTGNVGIGTTSPTAKLQIHNTSAGVATVAAYLVNESTDLNTETRLAFAAHTNDDIATERYSYISTINTSGSNGQAMTFATNATGASATEKMRIDSAGNVGIGTSSPDAKLFIQYPDATTNIVLKTKLDAAYSMGISNEWVSTYVSKLQLGRLGTSNSQMEIIYDIQGTEYASIKRNYGASSLKFERVGTTDMIINGSGNVGIGTTSPVKKLQVSNSATGLMTNLLLTNTHDTNGDTAGIAFSMTDDDLYNKAGIVFERTSTQGRGNLHFCNNNVVDSSNFSLADSALTILPTGNVGIGTTSPSYKLDVAGEIRLNSGNAFTNLDIKSDRTFGNIGGINFVNGSDDIKGQVYGNNDGSVRIGTNGTTLAVLVDSSQNVGIGTSSPSHKLDVNGDIALKGTSVFNLNSAALTIGDTAGTDSVTTLKLTTAGDSTTVYLDDGGNVGIGTTSPTFAAITGNTAKGLHIQNVGNDTQASLRLTGHNNTGIPGVATYTELLHAGGDLRFDINHNGTTALTINPNSNVGIGTDNPSYKLTVSSGTEDIGILTASSDSGSYVGFLDNATSVIPKIGAVGNKLILDASQYVGIKRTDPSYALDVSGTIRATGDVIAYSDARVKENVETIPNALDKVKAMRGVGYNKIGEEKRSIGVIAQEMLEVMPEVVSQDDQGMYSVAYGNLVGVLIEAMKDQQKQIDELKAQLNGIAS